MKILLVAALLAVPSQMIQDASGGAMEPMVVTVVAASDAGSQVASGGVRVVAGGASQITGTSEVTYDGSHAVSTGVALVDPESHGVAELAKMLSMALKSKNYLLLSGVLLMIFLQLLRKVVLPRLSTDERYKPFVPSITMAIAVLTGVATWFLNPKMDFAEVMATSVGIGFMAVGSFETMLKPFVAMLKNKKLNEEKKPEAAGSSTDGKNS